MLLGTSAAPADSGSRAQVLTRLMLNTCRDVNSMEYILHKGERIEGEMIYEPSYSKVSYRPFRAYSTAYGKNGPELLHVSGENGGKTLINPNGFPWINLSLNPRKGLMRKGQHHLFLDAGYIKLIPILDHYFTQSPTVSLQGEADVYGVSCTKVRMDIPSFGWQEYEVQGNEQVDEIASKFRVSAYKILEENENIEDFHDLSPGKIIRIPTAYASYIEFMIEAQSGLLRAFKVYDEKGLFEDFSYEMLKINVDFTDADFDPDNPDYGF